jgi:hypothetical protein
MNSRVIIGFILFEHVIYKLNTYRKLPLKNTEHTLKGPDGAILVASHWVFLAVAHDILYFETNDP